MRNSRQPSCASLTVLVVGLLAFSPTALPYLDPSTGSMVVSALVGIVASVALAVKTYWYRIKGLFKRSRGQESCSRTKPD